VPVADLTLDELTAWGEAYGASLVAPALVTLSGELGAGKTTLVQAIGRGCGVAEPLTSPTYNLVHEHAGARAPFFHLDLYRLKGAHELAGIGWDDIAGARAVVCVEWPDRAAGALGPVTAALTLAHIASAPERRRLAW
jgi:tRNA threonylcarbamoyladenosine biosynthesis protein TsaE